MIVFRVRFIDIGSNKEVYAMYNAILTRSRTVGNKKAGEPLPGNRFSVKKGYGLYKLLVKTRFTATQTTKWAVQKDG
jgi:hypothetical protein